MSEQPNLSEAEWALLVELLHRERDELPVEIHHTRNAAVRAELHLRRKTVLDLLSRLSTPAVA